VAATLDVPAQSVSNWVKAEQEGKLGGAGTKPVSAEQMQLSGLRAEVARLKMERDILKKARISDELDRSFRDDVTERLRMPRRFFALEPACHFLWGETLRY
jgi:transposase-like protein